MNDKYSVPLIGETAGLNVPTTTLGDGSSAYGTVIYSVSTKWVKGSDLQGRKLLVVVQTGAASGGGNEPSAFKLGLYKGTTSSGGSITLVTGTDTEWTSPPGNKAYLVEIDCNKLTGLATDFYSLGLSVNGGGSATLIACATALYLDPTYA